MKKDLVKEIVANVMGLESPRGMNYLKMSVSAEIIQVD